MLRAHVPALLVLAVLLGGCGPKPSPIQDPDSLASAGYTLPYTIMRGRSDAASARFASQRLPSMILLANESFNADSIARNFADLVIDPNRLRMAEASTVRVYFVGKNAGRLNVLGVNLEGIGAAEGSPAVIFPNTHTPVRLPDCAKLVSDAGKTIPWEALGERAREHPLLPGDFVDLGKLSAGTELNFFLVPDPFGRDGHGGPGEVYTAYPDRNPDGVQHVVAVALENSPYLILSFEDLPGGGDKDYSDCVFAVELSVSNIEALLGRLDPWKRIKQLAVLGVLLAILIGGPIAYAGWRLRRRLRLLAKAYRNAQEALEADQPAEALRIIRAHRHLVIGHGAKEQWTALELAAAERYGDTAQMCLVYNESPEILTKHETAAVTVGHAQIELDQLDAFLDIRNAWRGRETHAETWTGLDADLLARQGKRGEALTLLETRRAETAPASDLIAREALLCLPDDPGRARALLEKAVQGAPGDPGVRLCEGMAWETLGDPRRALAAYRAALASTPKDPFVRDRLADFYRRHNDMARALGTWTEGLTSPSMDFLWLRTLFWQRAGLPVRIDWPGERPAASDARPLVDYLLDTDPARFWDFDRGEVLFAEHPHLQSYQEVFWLQVFEHLLHHREDRTLSLLNLGRFGDRSWHPALETALIWLVTYRRLGFMDPNLAPERRPGTPQHPLFEILERWNRGEAQPDEQLLRLVRGEEAFSAALLAAGWTEAGLRLRRVPIPPGNVPRWFAEDVARALKRNRGEQQARDFAKEQGIRIE